MTPTNDDLIGKVLDGKYQILELLGQGGMGTVYKALHVFLQRTDVVKVVRTDPSLGLPIGQTIEREARLLSSLHHPNIIEIYAVGTTDDLTYLVMEYVEGTDLQQIIAGGRPLGVDYAIEIVSQVGNGLEYAHSKSILHRDIKPNNILIGTNGRVVLTDFGLARVPGQSTLTVMGTVLGTPRYMSPEQARGERLDARSDVYSLGVVLFELLTGRPPFLGETIQETFGLRVKATPPSPRELNPAVPSSIEKIVLRALATNPDERYQSAREFVLDLTATRTRAVLSLPMEGFGSVEVAEQAPAIPTSSSADAPTGEFAPSSAHSARIPKLVWILSGVLLFFVISVFWSQLSVRAPSAPPRASSPGSGGVSRPATFPVLSVAILFSGALIVWLLLRSRRTSKFHETAILEDSNSRETAALVEVLASRDAALPEESSNGRDTHSFDATTLASYPYRESPVASTVINREASAMALLQVLNGLERGRQFRMADSIIIGRGAHCDISLKDPTVSRTHAEVFLKNNSFHIYDLGSHGGIFVNELRVAEQELHDRDEIRIGDTILMFIQVVTPDDQTAEAKRRMREFDVIWKELSRAARRD